MRLLIAGASGRTGRLLVEHAIERGHEITALVRDAASLSAGERLRVVVGDVLEPATLPAAAAGQDAVVSLLAPRPRTSGRVYVEGTRNLADAAVDAGVHRFVVVSAEGAGVEPRSLTLRLPHGAAYPGGGQAVSRHRTYGARVARSYRPRLDGGPAAAPDQRSAARQISRGRRECRCQGVCGCPARTSPRRFCRCRRRRRPTCARVSQSPTSRAPRTGCARVRPCRS